MQFFVMWRSIVLIVLLVVICCCIEAKREESVVEKDTYTGNSDDKVNTPQTVKNEHPVITDQKFYDVLVVTLCLRGHLNPAGATVRALTEKGHRVTVIALDSCRELIEKLMPNIAGYHEMVLTFDFTSPSNQQIMVISLMDEALRGNLTVKLFGQLDDFITRSSTGRDLFLNYYSVTSQQTVPC
ncbi:uncharacterized protein LOC142337006 [Convolutriloba macropyga]|uniref:uncharacterized protein LOC142337006 n=1 Tax=Convolutriloba macropyga TaxID=536237 RepID=UPI003F52214E